MDQALDAALASDVRVYTIALSQSFQATARTVRPGGMPPNRTMYDYKKLDFGRLAELTGGRPYEPATLDQKSLAKVLRSIATEISMENVVGYQPEGRPHRPQAQGQGRARRQVARQDPRRRAHPGPLSAAPGVYCASGKEARMRTFALVLVLASRPLGAAGRLPRGPRALPRERVVAARPGPGARGAGQAGGSGGGQGAPREGLGARRREGGLVMSMRPADLEWATALRRHCGEGKQAERERRRGAESRHLQS